MSTTDVTTLKMLLIGEDRSASKTLRGVGDQAGRTGDQLKEMGDDAVSAARLLEELPKGAKGAVDRTSAEFKQLSPKMRAAVLDAQRDAARAMKDDSLSHAARAAGEDAGSELSGGLRSKIKGFAKTAGPLLAAGIGLAVGKGVVDGLNFDAVAPRLKAQLDLTETQSARAGKAAGELYAQNYSQSVDETADAIRSVIENIDDMRGASEKTLTDMGGRALATSKIFDQDLGAVTRAVSQMLRTGLAQDGEQAFDILTQGLARGADKADDLLDTFNEYSTHFRTLGLDGAEATGILRQGLQGGARDADQVADGLKEFSIRAVESTESVRGAFSKLGLDGTAMADAIASGGPRAREALDQTLDRLRGVKDPADRARIAAELFGTQSEDMAAALLKIDPSTATKGLGELAGASDRANESFNDTPMAKVLEVWNRAKQTAAALIAQGIDKITPALKRTKTAWQEGTGVIGTYRRYAEFMLGVWKKVGTWVRDDLLPWLGRLRDAFVKGMGGTDGMRKAFDDLKPAAKLVGGLLKVLWESLKWAAEKVMPMLAANLRRTTTVIGIVGRAATWLWNNAFAPALRFIVRGVANLMDMWAGLLRALGKIPGFGWARDAADKMSNAARQARGLASDIRSIKDRKVTVSIRTIRIEERRSERTLANAYNAGVGGRPRNRASGGPVFPGNLYKVAETQDEYFIPAMGGRIDSGRGHHRTAGGGDTINIYVDGSKDPKMTALEIESILTKHRRRRGGAPLAFQLGGAR